MLQSICKGNLGHRGTQLVGDNIKIGRSIPSLVLLRMISHYFAAGTKNEHAYALNDLQRVKITNGNIEVMQSVWIMVLSGMRSQPRRESLEEMYFDIVKKKIAHYRCQDVGSSDRTYAWLIDRVERLIKGS